jgi:hypothetical protein
MYRDHMKGLIGIVVNLFHAQFVAGRASVCSEKLAVVVATQQTGTVKFNNSL